MTTNERHATLQGFFSEARRLALLARTRAEEIRAMLPSISQLREVETLTPDGYTGSVWDWLAGKR